MRQVRKQSRPVPSWPIEHALPASPTSDVIRSTDTSSGLDDDDDLVFMGNTGVVCVCIYIYIYKERERDRDRETERETERERER